MSYISDATRHIVLQYLGKKRCVTHMEPQSPLGTFVTNIPPPSRSSRDSTRDEYQHITGECQPDYRTELGSPNGFADLVKPPGLPALQDTVYYRSSAIQASLAPTDAYQCHRPPSKELQNVIAIGSQEGVSPCWGPSVLSHSHATGSELSNQAPPFHPGPLPVGYGSSKGAKSSSDHGGIHQEGM